MAMMTTGLIGGSPPSFAGVLEGIGTSLRAQYVHFYGEVTNNDPIRPVTNCPNCGACYNRWDDDCNYCGTTRV